MSSRRAPVWALLLRIFASVVLFASVAAELEMSGAGTASAATSGSPGYWLVASDGGLYNYGTTNYGSMRGRYLAAPVVGAAPTISGRGYWMVASDGGIFTFGDAGFYGSQGAKPLNRPIVGMAATPTGRGYWLVASDGGIFSFGDAVFYGSEGGKSLNRPVVGMTATPSGHGYWLVASDGGIFTFGDAGFFGSMGGHPLNQPMVGMAADPTTGGYWTVASDGGIFTFNAPFYGSMGGRPLNKPITGMTAIDGTGYWMVARDGGIFTFGDAPFLGSSGANPGPAPVVAISATSHGYPFPPGSTGYDISNYQCGGALPPPSLVAIVEVAGAINGYSNPCYAQEAAWAGSHLSSYIFMNGLPSPAPAESLSGPAGVCNGNVECESYNFGWYWVSHWLSYSRNLGISPSLWWLDVETDPSWTGASSNSRVISGGMDAVRAAGAQPGIYSTGSQWGQITGNLLSVPGVPLWEPGGGNVSGGTFSAQNICSGNVPPQYGYTAFGGGRIVVVQYGLQGNGYTGPPSDYDQDYACP